MTVDVSRLGRRIDRWVMSWPRWAWYVAAVPFVLVFAVPTAALYAVVNGSFWVPFAWAWVALPVCWLRLWWYDQSRGRRLDP